VCKTDPNLFVSGSCDSLALVIHFFLDVCLHFITVLCLNHHILLRVTQFAISNSLLCPMFNLQVWDIRTGQSVLTFRGHTSDLNAVTFFPGGGAVGTGSDDHTCRIFDMRCVNELALFGNDKIISSVTSGKGNNCVCSTH
jgi:WD40 repeat protein